MRRRMRSCPVPVPRRPRGLSPMNVYSCESFPSEFSDRVDKNLPEGGRGVSDEHASKRKWCKCLRHAPKRAGTIKAVERRRDACLHRVSAEGGLCAPAMSEGEA